MRYAPNKTKVTEVINLLETWLRTEFTSDEDQIGKAPHLIKKLVFQTMNSNLDTQDNANIHKQVQSTRLKPALE
ncbi:hypothetical protein GCM10025859_47280 [Alicyclobacillus fastidiosus]|nr:hypothetical protein GCM10025859_47280 [Alicyclobacillus fastidiosus]